MLCNQCSWKSCFQIVINQSVHSMGSVIQKVKLMDNFVVSSEVYLNTHSLGFVMPQTQCCGLLNVINFTSEDSSGVEIWS